MQAPPGIAAKGVTHPAATAADRVALLRGGGVFTQDIGAAALVVVQLQKGQGGQVEGRGAFVQELAVDVQQRVQL